MGGRDKPGHDERGMVSIAYFPRLSPLHRRRQEKRYRFFESFQRSPSDLIVASRVSNTNRHRRPRAGDP